MNYSDNCSSVRVDFFRDTGKWYTTEAIRWKSYSGKLVQDAFLEALRDHLTDENGLIRLAGAWAVCLDPYHEHAFPLMMKVPEK